MIIEIDKPFNDMPELSRLYGCPQLFIDKKTNRRKHLKCKAVGCGNTERTIGSDKPANDYWNESRKYIDIKVNHGPEACYTGSE